MNQQDFYIGWQDKMPSGHQSFLKRFLIGLFIAVPILVLGVVFLQKPFNAHQFEFGNLKQFTGTYYNTPVPMLLADAGQLPEGIAPSILLVNFGKFGAESLMQEITKKHGTLVGKRIKLEGSLIYGAGKAVLELTNQKDAFIEIVSPKTAAISSFTKPIEATLKGEILDPKCYFGVMKPGDGKIHKSCAIRCISGGIPPVFRAETGDINTPYRYYLVASESGTPINQAILPYVGEAMLLKGNTSSIQDWDVLFVNLEKLPARTMPLSLLCSEH